ncbi:hypothetical protein [Methylophaga sp. OBS4]|uniref:hypothetical protein n=1 Tax=Methylophaga sp. OBS4 TaxID=2991935 RepID=UPI00224DB75C|nr:hypothetical protein [Methylophaga sp. OBS4]MCX4187154.1 phage baseplate assembly protein V [Methylophaga sp. OBS4]
MEELIKRLVHKLWPEMAAGYHLPIFGEVVGVRETPNQGDLCDEFRPRYAVDVQVLDEYGEPDTSWPVLKDVILALPIAGHERGQFAFPDNGTWVELAFAYGSPNRPFIRSVLPHRLTLPPVERGEQRWQHNPESFQNVDKDGNWNRKTDLKITDESLERLTIALDNLEQFHRSVKETKTNDTEVIGAVKKIQAYGAMVLQSGGVMDLASVDNMRITTKADAILKVIGNMQADIGSDHVSKAGSRQHLEAPKSWIGNESENGLRLMSDLAQLVIDLANILATHTHPNTGQIDQSGQVSGIATSTGGVKTKIDTIAE